LRRAWKPYRTAIGVIKQRVLTLSTNVGSPQLPPIAIQRAAPGASGNITATTPEARTRCENAPATEPRMAMKKQRAGSFIDLSVYVSHNHN
jgi:hypothetical protein